MDIHLLLFPGITDINHACFESFLADRQHCTEINDGNRTESKFRAPGVLQGPIFFFLRSLILHFLYN